jgi:glycine oxidase
MQARTICVVGAGVVGLWQALTLARSGHRVRLVERSAVPFAEAASAYAGAMLGPFCETETYAPVIRELGSRSLDLWRETYPGTAVQGTLVISGARDKGEVEHFARLTEGHERIGGSGIAALEPDLDGRFSSGLFYPAEAHLAPRAALEFLLREAMRLGVGVTFGSVWQPTDDTGDLIIDCRGLGAREDLPKLRGVRGERLVVRSRELDLRRPVRFLHPRHSIYVVPWGKGVHMIGATVIESEDSGPVTVRSALELLSTAYALHPAFGEAQIVEMGAGVRPAFADNVPRIVVRGRTLHVNGLYRHGFLLAPALAEITAHYLATGSMDNRVFNADPASPR